VTYIPSSLRVGGYTIDTTKTSHAAPLFGGSASLSPRDHHRLVDGLRRLFDLGMRPTAEFVLSVADGGLDVREMFDALDRFASADPEMLRVTGGNQMSSPQLREVPR